MNEKFLKKLSFIVGHNLKNMSATVTIVESCTGGWISKIITDTEGSSSWFKQGIITYSNTAKQNLALVNTLSLTKYGPVSKKVVEEMALNVLHVAKANFSIAVSGIAGPTGGNKKIPNGTVWFGFSNKNDVLSEKKIFIGSRNDIRYQATIFALKNLYKKFLR